MKTIQKCKRCFHAWLPFVTHPIRCPMCKSPYWMLNRRRDVKHKALPAWKRS